MSVCALIPIQRRGPDWGRRRGKMDIWTDW